jgi:dethiobiotin synthetase
MAQRISPHSEARGVFIAGTDTGVGKTVVACALLRALSTGGLRTVGMKPVAAGATRRAGVWIHEDVEQLRAAASVEAPRGWINPYCFAPAIAPHLAAREAGQRVRLDVIERRYRALLACADIVVVEGVGGVMVPLGRTVDALDIPLRLQLPVIMVVGLRLGCLNHALLTAAALRARGGRLAGWVACHIDPGMARPRQNLDALRERVRAPLLGQILRLRNPRAEQAARHLDLRQILTVI